MTTTTAPIYLRGARLGADDLRDLETYFDTLRAFYGIAAGEPVFPAMVRGEFAVAESRRSGVASKPSVSSRNSASHPWRNSL